MGVYRTSFGDEPPLRIIDIQSVVNLKAMVLHNLTGIDCHGTDACSGIIKNIQQELQGQMKQSLQHFADLACSEDCSLTDGPVLDSWTCLRIRAQCFRGSVCGG
ncbi:Izumo sperm-egg fusion protein, partial [Pristimantis euphronides]